MNNQFPFNQLEYWSKIPSLQINNYLWMNNNYKPRTEVKVSYSDKYLYLYFKVFEKEITAQYTNINDPVYKDNCVEFFINLFPEISNEYFNFEINAIGSIYVGFGQSDNRLLLDVNEIKKIEIRTTLSEPTIGPFGFNNWKVFLKIPFKIFERHYNQKFEMGKAKSNFYKCGDETQFEHYGAWNRVMAKTPNFHLPQYFGNLIFE